MAQIAPLGWYRGFDADGNPLAGGKLYTYEAGTSTPKTTYTSQAGTIANANPVILDSDGYADVWLDVGGYKFRLENSAGVLQREKDNIDGGSSTGFASQVVSRSSSFALGINDQNLVNVCTSALTISLLPTATAGDGFTAVIVNLSSGNVTIDPDGSETINNTSTLVIKAGNSAIISSDGSEWYAYGSVFNFDISDSVLRVVGSSDATKKLAFEVDGFTTATTRTLTVQDKSGILPVIETASLSIPATSAGPSSLVLAEDTDNGANTVTIIAPTTVTSNRTLTLPDNTGTVAVTSDIIVNQAIQTAKTDTFTTTSTSDVDITGFTVTITPTSTSKKVLVMATLQCSMTGGGQAFFTLQRNGTPICIGDTAGSRISCSASTENIFAVSTMSVTITYLDSPASVSALTYKVVARVTAATLVVNRGSTDANTANTPRVASTIIAMEA